MNCREFADFLNLYLDHELPLEARAIFDEHLAECPACRAYLDGYDKTVLAVKRCAQELVENALPAIPEPLVQAILAARSSRASESV